MKAHNGIQIAKSDNLILHLSLWYKKNKKLKKENREMQREIINLKYKILMKKPRMPVVSRKKKKVNLECDNQRAQENENDELYEDIQNL